MEFFLGTEFLVFEIFFPFVTLYSEKKLKFSFYHTSKYLTLVSFAMFQSPAPWIGTEKEPWAKGRGVWVPTYEWAVVIEKTLKPHYYKLCAIFI